MKTIEHSSESVIRHSEMAKLTFLIKYANKQMELLSADSFNWLQTENTTFWKKWFHLLQ